MLSGLNLLEYFFFWLKLSSMENLKVGIKTCVVVDCSFSLAEQCDVFGGCGGPNPSPVGLIKLLK